MGRVILSALAATVLGASAALAIARTGRETSYAGAATWATVLELAVGAALLVAAVALLAGARTRTLGALAVAAGSAWLAPLWVGWDGGPAVVRGLAAALAGTLSALVLLIAVTATPAPARRVRFPLIAIAALAIAASIALALVRDPLLDRYCWSDCTSGTLAFHGSAILARRLTWTALGLAAACGVGAFVAAFARPGRRRSAEPTPLAAGIVGLALAASALVLVAVPQEDPHRALFQRLFVLRSLALLGLAAALLWTALHPRLVRGVVTRLAVDLERWAEEGALERTLADALGDPSLRLGYPLGDHVVDAEGRALDLDPASRVTRVVGDAGPVALVESQLVDADDLERALGPAARLALGNERLRAEALVRLADLTASRTRVVEAADGARRRMERDLHDGAQQRMLALTYDLRVALALAEKEDDVQAARLLGPALDVATTASAELREIAHGIFPAELAAFGLEAALESLADLHPLRVRVALPPGRRYRPDREAAAYAAVAEAVDANRGPEPVTASLEERDGSLRVGIDGVEEWVDRLVHVEDRVRAAGGEVTVANGRLDVLVPAD